VYNNPLLNISTQTALWRFICLSVFIMSHTLLLTISSGTWWGWLHIKLLSRGMHE
jgi:hypothetical protein